MKLVLWQLYWLLEAYVLIPRARRRNARRGRAPTLRLSIWASNHGYHRLRRAIHVYWKVRNLWLYGPGIAISSWWFKATLWARPKCATCGQPLFTLGYCFQCGMKEAFRKQRLEHLTSGRKR